MNELERLKAVVKKGIGALQQGKQGALLDLRNIPADEELMFIGDLHARVDNLAAILQHADESGLTVREKLKQGCGILVFLGDAVHQDPYFAGFGGEPEMEWALREMQSSVSIMQDVFDLKRVFPHAVYYVLGNHDYLSDRFVKGGVSQGLEFRSKLETDFGSKYVELYERFLQSCPLLVVGQGIVATHGGPGRGLRTLEDVLALDPLVEEDRITESLQWGRFGRTYSQRHVKRFLKVIGQPRAFFIVGHSPFLIPYGDFRAQVCPRHYVLYAAGDYTGYASYRNRELKFIEVPVDEKKRAGQERY